MVHVGIDLHTRNMTLAAVNNNGDLLKMECIPCCKLQLGQFFASIDEPVQAVVECTSSWYWLDDWFREQRITLKLIPCSRQMSLTFTPASCFFRMDTICVSLYRVFFMKVNVINYI